MSIYKVLEQNINKRVEDFSEFLYHLKGVTLNVEQNYYNWQQTYYQKLLQEAKESQDQLIDALKL